VSVVLENEWARVMRFTLEPGSELPLHDASDRVIYALSDYTIEWTEGDEAPTEKSWTAGQAHWHAGGSHAVRNTGSSVAQFLVFERRGPALPAEGQPADEVTAEPSAPEHGLTLLDNGAVRVTEVTLEPGQSTGRHWGGYRVIYALSDYTIQWTEGDADPGEGNWSEGQAHWHGPADHEVENAGGSPARYLVVTFLR
jgi:quercetin dioxygenase-like cupin family protein